MREQEETEYSRLAQEYSRDSNYDALRAIHNAAPPPIVPFLGMCDKLNFVLLTLAAVAADVWCAGTSATSRSSTRATPTPCRRAALPLTSRHHISSSSHLLQGLINWRKRHMLSDVIENIAVMQQMQYERACSSPTTASLLLFVRVNI